MVYKKFIYIHNFISRYTIGNTKTLSTIFCIILSCIIVYISNNINYYNPLYWLPIYLTGILFTKKKLTSFFTKKESSKTLIFLYLVSFITLMILAVHFDFMYLYRLIAPILLWKISDPILTQFSIKPKFYWKYSFSYIAHIFRYKYSSEIIIFTFRKF